MIGMFALSLLALYAQPGRPDRAKAAFAPWLRLLGLARNDKRKTERAGHDPAARWPLAAHRAGLQQRHRQAAAVRASCRNSSRG